MINKYSISAQFSVFFWNSANQYCHKCVRPSLFLTNKWQEMIVHIRPHSVIGVIEASSHSICYRVNKLHGVWLGDWEKGKLLGIYNKEWKGEMKPYFWGDTRAKPAKNLLWFVTDRQLLSLALTLAYRRKLGCARLSPIKNKFFLAFALACTNFVPPNTADYAWNQKSTRLCTRQGNT